MLIFRFSLFSRLAQRSYAVGTVDKDKKQPTRQMKEKNNFMVHPMIADLSLTVMSSAIYWYPWTSLWASYYPRWLRASNPNVLTKLSNSVGSRTF